MQVHFRQTLGLESVAFDGVNGIAHQWVVDLSARWDGGSFAGRLEIARKLGAVMTKLVTGGRSANWNDKLADKSASQMNHANSANQMILRQLKLLHVGKKY